MEMQADIIREYAPNHWISHNSLGITTLNNYELTKKLDFASLDLYPNVDSDYIIEAMACDINRGTKLDNFWVLEHKNGYFNYSEYNLAITPGLVRAWAYIDISRGCNGIVFYRWRSNRWGVEQNPNGILRHDGSPRRAYFEIKQLCEELRGFGDDLAKTRVVADVAIIHNYNDIWAHEGHKQYKNYDPFQIELEFFKAITELGVTADLVEAGEDLSAYKVVLAPALMLLSSENAENLRRYVSEGGNLVVGIRTGSKNESNVVVDIPWPGHLAKICGVRVEEFEAFPDHTWNKVNYAGKLYDVKWWADVLHSETASVRTIYAEKFYAGSPAVTTNRYGKGTATYFGAAGCRELVRDFLKELFGTAGVTVTPMPERVYLTYRKNDKNMYSFIINMSNEEKTVTVPFTGINCFNGGAVGNTLLIKPLEVVIALCNPD
jgi:beta-galactosidase